MRCASACRQMIHPSVTFFLFSIYTAARLLLSRKEEEENKCRGEIQISPPVPGCCTAENARSTSDGNEKKKNSRENSLKEKKKKWTNRSSLREKRVVCRSRSRPSVYTQEEELLSPSFTALSISSSMRSRPPFIGYEVGRRRRLKRSVDRRK